MACGENASRISTIDHQLCARFVQGFDVRMYVSTILLLRPRKVVCSLLWIFCRREAVGMMVFHIGLHLTLLQPSVR